MSKAINYYLADQWQAEYKTSLCQNAQWGISCKQAINQIKSYLPDDKQCNILELGCGSSRLSEELSNQGYNNITCIDFSKELIKNKRGKNSKITYILSDFSKPFTLAKDTQYDLIIDKCSIDCLFCQQNFAKKVLTSITQCYKILKHEGHLISFSLAKQKNRRVFYRNKLTPFQIQIKNLKLNSTSTSRKTINPSDQSQLILIACKKIDQGQKNSEQGNYKRENSQQQQNKSNNNQNQQQEQNNQGQQNQNQNDQQEDENKNQQQDRSNNKEGEQQQQEQEQDRHEQKQQNQQNEQNQQKNDLNQQDQQNNDNDEENNQYGDQNFES